MPSLTSFILIGLALAGTATAEDCPTEALLSLASNTNLASCTAATGVSVSTISTLTKKQIEDICKSSACLTLMDDVAAMKLGDCTIPGSNVSVQTDVLDVVAKNCAGSGLKGTTDSTGSMRSSGSSSTDGGTNNVGDESSASSDKVTGSSSSKSGAAALTVGLSSAIAVATAAMLL